MTPIQALEKIRAEVNDSRLLDGSIARSLILDAVDQGLSAPKATSPSFPPLTLAQLHADELVATVRKLLYSEREDGLAVAMAARELLKKIDPPQPPTLKEALDLLREARDAEGAEIILKIDRLLDRVPK